jgi:uncharacterized membrane protein YgcG
MVPKCRGCGFSVADLDRKLRQVPGRVGFVNDFAGILAAEEKASLEERLSLLQCQLRGELVLTLVHSTRPVKPSEYVFWLFNHWQVGGAAHAGLMILLTRAERRIECEVGYAWEAIISEEESGKVLDTHAIPLLQAGRIAPALREGVEQFARLITAAIPPEQRAPEKPAAGEGGG